MAYQSIATGPYDYRNLRSTDYSKSSVYRMMASTDGFDDVRNVISSVYDDRSLEEGKEWEDIEFLKFLTRHEKEGHVLACLDENDNPVIMAEFETVESAIRNEINRLEGQFRRAGLYLLLSGFVYQLIAQLL